MGSTRESEPKHDTTPEGSYGIDSQQMPPNQGTSAVDAVNSRPAEALSISALASAGLQSEEGSLVEDEIGNHLTGTNEPKSLFSGVISNNPSLEANQINVLAATVEDCLSEDETRTRTPQAAQSSPSHTPHPSMSTLTTPTTPKSSTPPVESGYTVAQESRLTNEYREPSGSRRGPDQHTHTNHAARLRRRPSALDFLVSEPPNGNQQAALEMLFMNHDSSASHTHGSRSAPPPSVLSSRRGDAPGATPLQPEPHVSWTSAHSVTGDHAAIPLYQPAHTHPQIYGSPQMTPRNAPVPNTVATHFPLQSILQVGYGPENPPMSGYQLIAAKLQGSLEGPPVTPMYRRFEALHHRLLLYMQADIAHLEEELCNIDMKDTIERGYGRVPASRRQERWGSSLLGLQRTDVLGQIGYKLCQYNKIISSFRKLQDMPAPSMHEINSYKTYLVSNRLLVDDETGFLDAPEDLFTLGVEGPTAEDFGADEGSTPIPHLAEEVGFPASMRKSPDSDAHSWASARRLSTRPSMQAKEGFTIGSMISQLGLAMFVAVFAPLATFPVIPTFTGRVAVVLLVGASVSISLMQSGIMRLLRRGALDWMLCVGIYVGAMAAVASTLG